MKKHVTTLVFVLMATVSLCYSYPKEIEDVIIKNRNKDISKALSDLRKQAERGDKDEFVQIIDSLLIKFADGKTVYDIGLTTSAKVYAKGAFEKLKEGSTMFPDATSTWGKIPEELKGCEIQKAKHLEPRDNTLILKVKEFGTVTLIADGTDRDMLAEDGWNVIAKIKHGHVVDGPGGEAWVMTKTLDVGTYEIVGGMHKAMLIRLVRF